MGTVFIILGNLLSLYSFVLLARVVIDLIRIFSPGWQPRGIVLVIAELVYTLTDPPLNLLRRVIPPLRLGAVALDLGFIILYIGVQVLGGMLIQFGARMGLG